MRTLNSVSLVDYEVSEIGKLRRTEVGHTVISFVLSGKRVSGSKKEVIDDFDCVAWGETAVAISEIVKEGDSMSILGALKTYQDRDEDGEFFKYMVVSVSQFTSRRNDDFE